MQPPGSDQRTMALFHMQGTLMSDSLESKMCRTSLLSGLEGHLVQSPSVERQLVYPNVRLWFPVAALTQSQLLCQNFQHLFPGYWPLHDHSIPVPTLLTLNFLPSRSITHPQTSQPFHSSRSSLSTTSPPASPTAPGYHSPH